MKCGYCGGNFSRAAGTCLACGSPKTESAQAVFGGQNPQSTSRRKRQICQIAAVKLGKRSFMISKRQIVGLVFAVSAIAYAGFYPTQSIAEAPPLVPLSQRADFVEVSKGNREMRLLRKGKVIRRYQIALGFAPKGDKQREGDGKTPEGLYLLDFRNPNSSFHLSLHINYPSPFSGAGRIGRWAASP